MRSGLTNWGEYKHPLQSFIDSAEPSIARAGAAFLGKSPGPKPASPTSAAGEPEKNPVARPETAPVADQNRADAAVAAQKLGIPAPVVRRLAGTAPEGTAQEILIWIIRNR